MYMFTARVQVQSRSQIPNASGVWGSSRFSYVYIRCECGTNQLDFHKIESIFSTVDNWLERGTNQLDFHKIESIFSTVDERATNQLDFQKIESMHVHSTSDDWVKRGTNRIDFADHRDDIIGICRRKDSIFESTILKQTAHHTEGEIGADNWTWVKMNIFRLEVGCGVGTITGLDYTLTQTAKYTLFSAE